MPFGWGIVSTGKHPDIKIAPAMAAANGGELVGVYSRDQHRVEAFAQKHHARAAYSQLGDLLKDSRVHGVFVSSPNAAGFDTAGAKAVFRVNVDDYAEVWINGAMPRTPGRPSPGAIQGFNMPNRVVLADGAVSSGDRFEIAVFAINGPISAAPGNFLFVREAKVEFFR